jgi:hypothetical protein
MGVKSELFPLKCIWLLLHCLALLRWQVIKNFCKLLRPGYVPAERHDIAGPILDKLYEVERERTVLVLHGVMATLAIDGWSNINNDPVIGIAIAAVGKSYLVDTVDTTGQSHTADYLLQVTKDSISKAENDFGIHIGSVVTDGASNMVSMRNQLSQDRAVFTYGCQPHQINLLSKDIQKHNSVVTEKILAVVKYFRNVQAATAMLKDRNLPKPPLPAETRWNTLKDTLEYYDKNWSQLLEVATHLLKPADKELKYLENFQLRRSVSDLLKIYTCIAVNLDKLQSDTATIAFAVECWLDLLDELEKSGYDHAVNKATERSRLALDNPAFLAANLLDHRFSGHRLTPQQVQTAIEFVVSLHDEPQVSEVRTALTMYLAKSAPYNTLSLSQDIAPADWWSAGLRLGFSSSLVTVAVQLTSAVATSAGLERQFSTMKLTYGTLRTRLGIAKAGKLSFLFRKWNE